ncbi:hypothetical protein E9232_003377 [Inquilinus ginsengisoli]|uniref:Uncharacterized protein n=1 Tax=Inquilinus ginsengisoli TaxID=363840 RepID=A0ABU1JQF9_9PROT|nr:hypothetical protein [Inquilinus ginsengisoli]MDR6290851.1 hypothetical protein [Inquilinus ginsengisoli]
MPDIPAIAGATTPEAPAAERVAEPVALTEAQIAEIRALVAKADELVSAASSANTNLAAPRPGAPGATGACASASALSPPTAAGWFSA